MMTKKNKVQPGEVWNNRRKDRGVEADQGVARHGQLSHLKIDKVLVYTRSWSYRGVARHRQVGHLKVKAAEKYLKINIKHTIWIFH